MLLHALTYFHRVNSTHGRVKVCAWLTATNSNWTIKRTDLFDPTSHQKINERSFCSVPMSWHRFTPSREAGLPWESRCVPMSLKGCLSSMDRSVASMCPCAEDTHHAVPKKRVSEPSRHPVSPACFSFPSTACCWLTDDKLHNTESQFLCVCSVTHFLVGHTGAWCSRLHLHKRQSSEKRRQDWD